MGDNKRRFYLQRGGGSVMETTAPIRKAGRPSGYRREYAGMAETAAADLNVTDKQLAKLFSVTKQTIVNWKEKHKDFAEALATGKEEADAKVVKSLYDRATGYTYTEKSVVTFPDGTQQVTVHEKHAPPDVGAQVKWLYNRQPKRWRPQPLDTQDDETPPPMRIITYAVGDMSDGLTDEQWEAMKAGSRDGSSA